ncbi:MAG TPA: LytTR family transcriptional regulator DNA-binding domain-containing protein [Draconibacterium sp.]|nr:LytTR family transcriptional regulator DNA-binding domain-containing protein [Draconibacterium sp.]
MSLSFLNKKFTLLDNKADRYLLIAVVFVFSVIFLNVYEPFNIGRWYSDSGLIKFLRLSSYGFVIAIVFLFTQFPMRKILHLQEFKVKNYIIWLVIEIALINLVYIFLYGNPIGNFMNDLGFSLKYTLLSIWLPYSFAILIVYYKNQRDEIKSLKTTASKPTEKRLIILKDENGKIKFSVVANDLLLLESTDNYVSVYYILQNKVQRKLLRNSLKNLEPMLKESAIIRCHRSFMVNPANVEFMQKKGKKLNIKIKQFERSIPVSEKYSSPFLDFLT